MFPIEHGWPKSNFSPTRLGLPENGGKYVMQKTLTIIGVSVLMTLVCYANIVKAGTMITPDIPKGYITGKITDHYERISDLVEIKNSIHLNIRCTSKIVPIIVPGRRAHTATPGEMLGGAVIGGVLGKLLTNDDKGAIGGAIMGGLATQSSRQSDTIEYRKIDTCKDVPRYKIVTKDEYSHSTINFSLDGISYDAKFIKHGLVELND